MFGGAILSYVFLGLSFVISTTQHQPDTRHNWLDSGAKPQETESLKCYDCNSEYDPRCADPFNPYSIGMINCTDRKPPDHFMKLNLEPVLCRKMIQKVEGRVRVIRSCGYIRDDHDDKKCYRRTGTSAVEVIYCSCTSSLCNTGHSMPRPTFRLIAMAVSITLAITTLLNSLSS